MPAHWARSFRERHGPNDLKSRPPHFVDGCGADSPVVLRARLPPLPPGLARSDTAAALQKAF